MITITDKTITVKSARKLTDEDLRLLIKEFADHCIGCHCSRCRYKYLFDGVSGIGKCLDKYLKEVREGKVMASDSFEENPKKKMNPKKKVKHG